MSATRPRISIVIAVLNAAGVLARCLDSIAAQTFADYEVIVVDGGSTDGTLEQLRSRAAMIAHWESGPDSGVYEAWNKALAHARGEWICFLGADDRLHDADVLARIAPRLAGAYPAARVVYGRLNVIDADGRLLETLDRPWVKIRSAFRAGLVMVPHPGVLHHRSLFDQHGMYDASFRIAGDYDLLLRELATRDALYLDELVTVDMQIGGISGRPESLLLAFEEIRRARAKSGVRAASPRLRLKILLARVAMAVYRLAGPRALRWLIDLFRLLTLRKRKWTV